LSACEGEHSSDGDGDGNAYNRKRRHDMHQLGSSREGFTTHIKGGDDDAVRSAAADDDDDDDDEYDA
jgi:hypothetical protein